MKYFAEIIPYNEARLYLSKRFSRERTSQEIEKNRFKKDSVPNYDFTCIEKIAQLERDLDREFEVTELMKRYFKPLKLREERPSDPISIGAMLLNSPQMLTEEATIDTVIEYFRENTLDDNMPHFFKSYLLPIGVGDDNKHTLNDFMQLTNELLADSEEKWAFVDAAMNPIEHLQKLKPLVSAVTEFIRKRCAEFGPLVKHIGEYIASKADRDELFVDMIHFSEEEMDTSVVFPSLFLFSEVIFTHYSNRADQVITLGCYIDVLVKYRKQSLDPEAHISLLKVLADNMRFNVLHGLCDNSSYGLVLADEFGVTRNAMYYQLEKLVGYGLLSVEYDERRLMYTMNKKAVFEKLTALRDYLVNGWKPEDYKE